jgi:hypothetical protein
MAKKALSILIRRYNLILISILIATVLIGTDSVYAQTETSNNSFITVNGIVKNKQNKKKLQYVNVFVKGTNIGTVTNEDGEFTLKVKKALQAQTIVISHVGYNSNQINLTGNDINNTTVWLTPQNNVLDEVIVRTDVARDLVRDAIRNIPNNYENKDCLLTGFYRETARKRQHYINISEAVIDLFKTSYEQRSAERDRVQILKGRKLLSEKKGDTLAVRLLGGPNLSIYDDFVKNPDELLNEENLIYYNFKMESSDFIDDQMQYVITFEPNVTLSYPLYYGKLYIDRKTLTFTRIELSIDMRDKEKVTQNILRKKPLGLKFKPQELTFLVTYKKRNGKYCLNYIRNEIRFKCDWKKKLFSTSYGIVSEMVVTDLKDDNVKNIPYKYSFNIEDSFTDKVKAFTDEDFWGAYNIIAPTESLDKAVNKLKKQHKE